MNQLELISKGKTITSPVGFYPSGMRATAFFHWRFNTIDLIYISLIEPPILFYHCLLIFRNRVEDIITCCHMVVYFHTVVVICIIGLRICVFFIHFFTITILQFFISRFGSKFRATAWTAKTIFPFKEDLTNLASFMIW